MTCPSCGRELPAAFPGGTVTCACGRCVELARGAPVPASVAAAPYRASAGAPAAVERTSSCPYCGSAIGALVRICPRCDVRLEAVRCARCFWLHRPGAFACERCGEPMPLEPLLDATDAPCPRCATPLEIASQVADARTHECPRCGGIFVSRDALVDILERAAAGAPMPELAKPRVLASVEIRYLACPLCHVAMNRTSFAKSSGVVVDVCSAHGTWFDAGELTRAVAQVAARKAR